MPTPPGWLCQAHQQLSALKDSAHTRKKAECVKVDGGHFEYLVHKLNV